MFIVSKTFSVEETHLDTFVKRFDQPSPILSFDGFVKREIAIMKGKDHQSFVRMDIYFHDKQAYYRWEGSPEHIAMHKQKHEKPLGLIDVVKHHYQLYRIDGK